MKKIFVIKAIVLFFSLAAILNFNRIVTGYFTVTESHKNQLGILEANLFGEDYGRKTYKVVGVADGDTIDIEINDKKERVRLMGIDAPETIKPFGAPDCYGRESYEKTKEMLLGKYIVLQSDESTNNNDASKIPLMYAILEDGTDFNKFMIGEGFAYEFSSDKPYKFQKEYKAIEAEAKNMKKGLWGACSA